MPKFKLLSGGHTQTVREGGKFRNIEYSRGDVFEDDTDLVARFGSDKFARIRANNGKEELDTDIDEEESYDEEEFLGELAEKKTVPKKKVKKKKKK